MANGFVQRVTTIKGLSDKRRLPRLGIIRLGIKKKSAKGVEYPAEVDYFVVPPEVQKLYGEKPKELDVMIPLNEIEAVFPCAYKHYGSSKGLKCSGDGEKAWRVNEQRADKGNGRNRMPLSATRTKEMQSVRDAQRHSAKDKCRRSLSDTDRLVSFDHRY